jgi:ATP synthase subunit 6
MVLNMFIQPLEQFSIIPIYVLTDCPVLNTVFSVNTIILNFCFILSLVSLVVWALNKSRFIGTNMDFFMDDFFSIVYGWFTRQLKSLHSRRFFPLLFTIFLLILVSNFLGLVPFSFTLTSQLYVTFLLAFALFMGIIILGICIYKVNFVKLFVPSGISSKGLLFFIILIEVVSYFIRPFSLAIRLFANMLAGHTLLYILGDFGFNLFRHYVVGILVIPFFIIFFIFLLEIGIAFIQAYVFIILLMIYLNDIYDLGH